MAQPNLLLVSIMEAQWYSVDPKERDALRHLLYTLNVMPYDGLGPTDQVATFFVPYDALEDITPFFAPNHYKLVANPAVLIPLHATTQKALETEVGGIKDPFHLYLTDFKAPHVGDRFMMECPMMVSLTARDPNVTNIGSNFLAGHSLTTVDMSGMVAVTGIGSSFLLSCPSLTTLDMSGMVAVTEIDARYGGFLENCPRLHPRPTRESILRQEKKCVCS